MEITKEQLQTIIDNAPAGSNKVALVKGLYERGVTVKGVDSVEADKYFQTYETAQLKKQQAQVQQEQPVDDNLGTGFEPTFEKEEDDPIVVDVAKTIGNIPKSGFMLTKDIWTAISNPIDTAKTIKTLVEGASANLAQATLENTEWGQKIIEVANQSRIDRGLPELERDEEGKYKVPETEASAIADQVGAYYRDRYGSWDNMKESLVEDPVGVLGDVSAIVSGGGTAVSKVGTASRFSKVADVGRTISRVGDVIEPTTAITRGTGTMAGVIKGSLPGRVVSEASPTASRFVEGQVVKALDLTQGDVARITEKTGNDVTDFVTRNDVLKETPEMTAKALNDFSKTQYDLVRSEVAKVTDVYKATDVPRARQALETVKNTVDELPGLEDVSTEVNKLLEQDTYSLSDIQRIKEILDANTNIYTRSGEARGVATAQGLANVRSELRGFIEDEVSRVTDGQTNIGKLNNDVATSRELANAIELRETRGMTRQQLSVFDGILGFSAYTATGDPVTALGIVVAKKVAETPSMRIAVAKLVNATPVETLNKWATEIAENNVSPQTRQSIANLVEEAQKNAQFIEAGAQTVTEATEQEENQ